MYIVVQARSGGAKRSPTIGQTFLRDTWEEAVDLAVELAVEQCSTPERDIRAEVEEDGDFADPDGEWSIAIGQPED